MSNSSAPTTYYTTSSSTGFIAQEISALSSDTITLTTGSSSDYYYTGTGLGGFSSDTITISNGGAVSGSIGIGTGNVTIGTISGAGTGFNWKMPEEFVDAFPDYNRIQKMCEEYPGLKIAYEKFVTTYKLVKDHYDTPEDKRPKP